MNLNNKRVLIVGCGYTGIRLAIHLQRMGCSVVGTARSEQRIALMQEGGVEVVTGALDDRSTLERLVAQQPDMVVYFVPPVKQGTDPLPGILDAFSGVSLEAFIYASATSVYGDHDGEWVDEGTPVVTDGVADAGRIQAEEWVLDAYRARGLPARICRISGIYGPDRTLKGILASGHYKLIEGHDTWVGRIHVDDLVAGITATWTSGENGLVYNMVDQRPHLAFEFANLAAELQNLPPPTRIGADEAREKYSESEFRRKIANKRIRCMRLVEDLGVELKYPTFELGLPASVDEDRATTQ